MAATLGSASIPLFATACLLIVMILQILSFASSFWAHDDGGDFGLWRYSRCDPTALSREDGCAKLIYTSSREHIDEAWFDAVRGLECLAIIFWAFPIVIVPVYMYTALGLHYRCVMATMTVLAILGTGCNIAGVVIFAIEIDDNDNLEAKWCIYVAGIAGLLGILSCIIFFLAICFRPMFTVSSFLMSGLYVDPYKDRMYVIENTDDLKSEHSADGGQVNPALQVE